MDAPSYVAKYVNAQQPSIFSFPNFSVDEIWCNCSVDEIHCATDEVCGNLLHLFGVLQVVRESLGNGYGINIHCSYRDPEHNKRVGGSATSQHLTGSAVDLDCMKMSPFAFARYLKQYFPKSFGQIIYYKNFVHVALPSKKFPSATLFNGLTL